MYKIKSMPVPSNSLSGVKPLSEWLPATPDGLLVIAGPCSAESYQQVITTARELAALGKVKVFRAGAWKPRTRPGTFEGKGEEALGWLREVKAETGLLTAVEVATPHHVDLCLKYGIDVVWIGSRTSVNPFSVQEIAAALQGTDLPVLVKNPLNPDLELWIGVLERVYQAGISKLAAVHRGFNTYDKSKYRNAPLWEIPIELRRMFPELPVICDPSHISGNRTLLGPVAQQAVDLDYSGLMMEVHCAPDQALTDARQQIKPRQLDTLLNNLVIRKPTNPGKSPAEVLQTYRRQIDEVDHQILELMARRMSMVEQIGWLKKENDITVLQIRRWHAIYKDRMIRGKDLNLDAAFIKKILELVHKESIDIQTRIMNQDNNKSIYG